MINKWILNNFKSIDEEKELEFRPLTIFTGANSSGKSTILQSILLVTQTLQSPIMSRSIVLNGGIKKLGSYGDIVYRRQWKKDMTIGFEIGNELHRGYKYLSPFEETITGLDCKFTVAAKSEDDLQPYLKKMQLVSRGDDDKEASVLINRIDNPSEKVKKMVETMSKQPDPEVLNNSVVVKNAGNFSRIHFSREPFTNTIGTSLRHFLPGYLLSSYNIYDTMSEMLFDRIYADYPHIYSLIDDVADKLLSEELKDMCKEVADALKDLVAKHPRSKKKKRFEVAYDEYLRDSRFVKFIEMYRLCDIPLAEKAPLVDVMKDAIKKIAPRYAVDRVPSHIIPGVDYLREFFSDHIWYLGPLREEPKALYPLEGDNAMNEVGYKGENTAAVYDYNKEKIIEYVSPASFDNLSNLIFKTEECTLEKAIARWLAYLGVASDIITHDKGKIGHELKISTDINDMKQDLTHVGVGVSQVLPILVMSLLAEKGDVIIMEQPELHLHPKVQTRLADFFVSMNAIGKQCVIETHSEYMIKRLRYLVALSDDTKIADDTMIYFVEKEKGSSKYRPVTINKYGVIEEWPDGFFDESEKIAAEILRAGMEKKAQEQIDDYEE